MIQIGEYADVIVESIEPRFVIVKFKNSDETAMIHISRISPKFVQSIEDFLHVGDEVTALGVESKLHPVDLSLVHLDLPPKYRTPTPNKKSETYHKRNDRRPRNHPSTSMSSIGGPPPEYIPPAHKDETLDQMIDRAKKSFDDKYAAVKAKNRDKGFHKPMRRR